ncbi:MAG: glycosyltransferase family 2 protein [Acetobacteraceae bacterium]
MSFPQVSIIMPTFNRTAWMRAAIESVFAQTLQEWELIIGDDGSDAPTRDCLRALANREAERVRVLFLTHGGNPPAVRNRALREARAGYVAFLDSDDLWQPCKLERQLASLRARPERGWSYTRCVFVDGSGRPRATGRPLRHPQSKDGWIVESLLAGEAVITQSSVMVRRELLERSGVYPPDLPICGDYDLYVRLALRSPVDFLDDPLVLVRRHDQHYCDDITALSELLRFFRGLERLELDARLARLVRSRRAGIFARLARAQAAGGSRLRALRTLLSSAPESWRYGAFWPSAAAATARAFAPSWAWGLARSARTLLSGRIAARGHLP